jgi:large subunit ribosomal protein L24
MKILKGDKVKIMAGKDKGREGKIERVYKKQGKALIEGINIYKRHIKKSEKVPQGGIIDVPRPIDVSKIMLICPKCNKPSKISIKRENKKKIRICKKCKSVI